MSVDTLFELDDFAPAPVHDGPAPLRFTVEYFTPAELIEADRFAGRGAHTWRSAITLGECGTAPGHSLFVLSADIRCACWLKVSASERMDGPICACPGDLMFQANCTECRWHVIGSERDVVEGWHDHAWPGWRDLPIVPAEIRPVGGGMGATALDKKATKAALAWIDARYPSSWHVDGAPIRTERTRTGTRHVPGYSPWGGFDMCARIIEDAA